MDKGFASKVGELELANILFFGFCTIAFLGVLTIMYLAFSTDTERHAFQKECVDMGGIPVITYEYVKGSRDGHLCINPSAVIELKEEK
jgi:hypothetical protein